MIILSIKSDLQQFMMFKKDLNVRRVIWVTEMLRTETPLLIPHFWFLEKRR